MIGRRVLTALLASAAVLGAFSLAEAQTLRIGVFDAQKIFNETAEGAKVQAKLNALEAQKRTEIEQAQQELAAMRQELIATATSMSQDKQRELRLKMDRKTIELDSLQKSATREFQLAVEQAQADWQDRIVKIVQEFGKKNGYTLIVPIGIVAFRADSTDITSELIKIVDAASAPAGTAAGS